MFRKNADLSRIDRWYEGNEIRRNHDKYKAMVLGTTTEVPAFMCENINIAVEEQIDLLGVTVDNKLMFESHVAKICRKVSQHIAVLNRMKKTPARDSACVKQLLCHTLQLPLSLGIFAVSEQQKNLIN